MGELEKEHQMSGPIAEKKPIEVIVDQMLGIQPSKPFMMPKFEGKDAAMMMQRAYKQVRKGKRVIVLGRK